jgi:type VI secretion system protein ImpJ
MFLQPQHFQQQIRYLEDLAHAHGLLLGPHAWGCTEISLDRQLLPLGKLGIAAARGILPDGTPFRVPENSPAPPPLEVTPDIRDQVVYLALPVRRPGAPETVPPGIAPEAAGLARYTGSELEVADNNAGSDSSATVVVGVLRLGLLLGSERRSEYACIPIARIQEVRADKMVVLDEQFVPTVLDCQATPQLVAYLKEMQGMIHQRARALAGRISASGRGSGVAEIADFQLLQVANRYTAVLNHLVRLAGLHPEAFYRLGLEMMGELATFTSEQRRPPELPEYRHDDLQASFDPLMAELRRSLSMVMEQSAINIPLVEKAFGVRVATIADRGLLDSAGFVLAVQAQLPTEEVRRLLPQQIKIGPLEQIKNLVNLQLPGIRVVPLPVAPRQLPYHAGRVYFELDRTNELWGQLSTSAGLAFHVSNQFPGVEMELWAIKG